MATVTLITAAAELVMVERSGRLAALLALVAVGSGCAVPTQGFEQVADVTRDRVGAEVTWRRDQERDPDLDAALDKLLEEPLTGEAAVKVALLNNARLQATFEDLGLAQADLFQAGLIANPHTGVEAVFPTLTTPDPNIEADFGVDFLGVLTIAARKRIAEAHLEATQRMLADAVLTLVQDVRVAFVELQAAQQLEQVNLSIAQARQASLDTATALFEAGNISPLEMAREQAQYEDSRLAWNDAQGAVVIARERVNGLLGLWGARAMKWQVTEPIAGVPEEEVTLDQLGTLAVSRRMDLQAAIKHTEVAAHRLNFAIDWGWLHGFEVAGKLERDDGGLLVGPEVHLALPLFDQGQGERARGAAELRRRLHLTTALATDIRAEVRMRRDAVMRMRRKAIHLRDVVIPLRERIVDLTLQHYNFMLVGVFEVLTKKQEQAEAYRTYLQTVRDYWVARAELARATGGPLPGSERQAALPPPQLNERAARAEGEP